MVEVSSARASLAVTVLLFTGLLSLTLSFLPEPAGATTLYVGGGGPGNYTTVQEAIDAANDGDTVYVFGGTYYENVIVNKRLSLIGES